MGIYASNWLSSVPLFPLSKITPIDEERFVPSAAHMPGALELLLLTDPASAKLKKFEKIKIVIS